MITRMLRLLPCLAALIFILLPVAPLLASPPAVLVQPPVAKMRPASFSGGSRSALLVPSQYPTIQAGVDASQDGDTVLVADGTYTGDGNRDIDLHGKSITVTSQNGPVKTIIDCGGYASTDGSGNHRGFYIHSGEKNATISGFTVKNGYEIPIPNIFNNAYEAGGGIYTDNSGGTITLTNCIITNNTAQDLLITFGSIGGSGGGIYNNNNGGTTTVTNCTVTNNIAPDGGGGIFSYVVGNSSETITLSGMQSILALAGPNAAVSQQVQQSTRADFMPLPLRGPLVNEAAVMEPIFRQLHQGQHQGIQWLDDSSKFDIGKGHRF